MGYCGAITTVVVAVIIGVLGYFILQDGELPTLAENQFWGPASLKNKKEDISVRPFHINISEKVLSDLKTRLKLEATSLEDRIADPVEDAGFRWGFHKKFLKKVQDHWLNKYDWRAREQLLNKWPNFKTTIFGIEIHFQHVKPTPQQAKKYKSGVRPLLLLHGWPGSFVEYQNIIPKLVEPRDSDITFEIVVASLPGHGFSQAASRDGLGTPEIAQLMFALMKRLGHDKFYVSGGDWGSVIAANLATIYKDNILGVHMTMCNSYHPRSLLKFGAALALPQLFLDDQDQKQFSLVPHITRMARELGYLHLQATKPETVGIAISYSPSGLATWILEKFSFWTDEKTLTKEDGDIPANYDLNTLLDNVMVHWVGRSSTTSLRIYSEFFNPLPFTQMALDRVPTDVPAACRNYPNELLAQPRFVLTDKFANLVRFTRAQTGGHLATFQLPDDVAQDIIATFNLIAKGITSGGGSGGNPAQ